MSVARARERRFGMASMHATHGSDARFAFVRVRSAYHNAGMETTLITLAPSQATTLLACADMRVHCLRGMLWIVGQCDREDVVLQAGDSALLAAQQALTLSSVRHEHAVSFELSSAPCAGGLWFRLRQLLRRCRQFRH